MPNYPINDLVEALRYCVAAQRATSGDACRSCKAAELFGCNPVQACILLNEVAADYIEAMEADFHHISEPCKICAHNADVFGCDIECEACNDRCACYFCTDDYKKFEWRGPQKEDSNG